jgi:hypothetical protein
MMCPGPYVTTVGGTYKVPEVAISFSGGGFSNYFAQPSYQSTAVAGYLKTFTSYSTYFNKYAPASLGLTESLIGRSQEWTCVPRCRGAGGQLPGRDRRQRGVGRGHERGDAYLRLCGRASERLSHLAGQVAPRVHKVGALHCDTLLVLTVSHSPR